jgi:hypothetical protein
VGKGAKRRAHHFPPNTLQHNNPTGKSLQSLSIPHRKNIPLAPSGKSVI